MSKTPTSTPIIRLDIEVDGSFWPDTKKGTASAVFRHKEKIIKTVRTDFEAVSSSHAEYLSIILGLETLIKEYESLVNIATPVRLYSDCQSAVMQINKKAVINEHPVVGLHQQTMYLIEKFKSRYSTELEVYWIPREKNSVANGICRNEIYVSSS